MSIDDIDIDQPTDEVVVPVKTSFRDERMQQAACPLCHGELRLVQAEDHAFGEFGFFQCSECGATMDICNMVDKPMEFHMVVRVLADNWILTQKSFLKHHSDFVRMPYEASRNHQKAINEEAKLDKLEAQVRCASCDAKFNQAPSAKSILTLEYCAPCRRKPEVREEVAKREAEAKAAAKKAKAKTRKKTKRKAA